MTNPDALASLIGHGQREQTVFTPPRIIDVVLQLWGRIAWDPCHGPPGVVLTPAGRQAKRDKLLPDDAALQIAQGLAEPVESIVPAEGRTDKHGLILPWPDHTYCNPPYDALAAWLAMSLSQSSDHVLLIPVRCHRKWWRAWRREAEVVALDPLDFVGHDQTFPGPLCLGNRNPHTPGQLTKLCEAAGLGEAF